MSFATNENENRLGGRKKYDLARAIAGACFSEAETVVSEDYGDDYAESGGRDRSESEEPATFSLSMSGLNLDEPTYSSDDDLSSSLDLEEEGENDEADGRAWKRRRDLRLSFVLGISADERIENRLAARAAQQREETGDDDDDAALHEEDEFEFPRSARMRRCSSLKNVKKTPPGTPQRRKAVRFANVLGLDLASVRRVVDADDPPVVPPSATNDLNLTARCGDDDGFANEPIMVQVRHLCACFLQPVCCPDFRQRVGQRKVSLETCTVDDRSLTVGGVVRVANVAFEKRVVVRHTVNGWLTHADDPAMYVPGSNDGSTDRFTFAVRLPEYFGFGSRFEFSVMYVAAGDAFWDSNFGKNYRVECYFEMEPFRPAKAPRPVRFY